MELHAALAERALAEDGRPATVLQAGGDQLHLPFDGAELRLTTAYFRGPADTNLDREHLANPKAEPWGVMPDRGRTMQLGDEAHAALKSHLARCAWLPSPGEFKDTQLDASVAWLRGQIKSDVRR